MMPVPVRASSTVLPASAVPEMTSEESDVTPSVADSPVSPLTAVIAACAGAVVSITIALVSAMLLPGSVVEVCSLPAAS